MKPRSFEGCLNCIALCCRFSRVSLSPKYAADRAVIAAGNSHEEYGKLYLNRNADGCVYLDATINRCTIYTKRPIACRGFVCTDFGESQKLAAQAVCSTRPMVLGLKESFVFTYALGDKPFARALMPEYERRVKLSVGVSHETTQG